MISAIVFVPDAQGQDVARESERLVRSLTWLVSAVVSGVVRDVTLAGREALGLAEVADQAGCGLVAGADEAERLRQAVAASRNPRVLILTSGFLPGDTMIGELDALTRPLAREAAVRLQASTGTLRQRLLPGGLPTVGVFAPTSRCLALPARRFPQLVAALKPKVLFATRAVPIP